MQNVGCNFRSPPSKVFALPDLQGLNDIRSPRGDICIYRNKPHDMVIPRLLPMTAVNTKIACGRFRLSSLHVDHSRSCEVFESEETKRKNVLQVLKKAHPASAGCRLCAKLHN